MFPTKEGGASRKVKRPRGGENMTFLVGEGGDGHQMQGIIKSSPQKLKFHWGNCACAHGKTIP
jgi:hypothetical protein